MKLNFKNIKHTGFKTPNNYFDTVEDKIMDALHQENNLNLSKETGFKTPDNYFDTIESVIMTKIETENTTKVIKLISKRNLIYVSSIAAAILLLFNLSIFNKNITFGSLDTETVENYIIYEDISSYELAALLSDDNLVEADFIQQSFTDNTLENYLLDNLDLEELIIE
jgi:uncharacterized membrane protein YvbJ